MKIDVPAAWADAAGDANIAVTGNEFIDNILTPVNRLEGDNLPVSTFNKNVDGTFPSGTSAYEKTRYRDQLYRNGKWINVSSATKCSFVCPHAVIRPVLMTEAEAANAPQGLEYKDAIGAKELKFHMAISPLDCTGCGNCAQVCPAKEKAWL